MRHFLPLTAALPLVACGPQPATAPPEQPAVVSAPVESPVDLSVIPAAYLGEWSADPARCGAEAGESRLRIEPERMRFYESVATVSAVRADGDAAIVTADHEGEGERWQAEHRLSLSDDGAALTISGQGASFTRRRCGA